MKVCTQAFPFRGRWHGRQAVTDEAVPAKTLFTAYISPAAKYLISQPAADSFP